MRLAVEGQVGREAEAELVSQMNTAEGRMLDRLEMWVASDAQSPKTLLTPCDELGAFKQFIERHDVYATGLAPE